MWKRDEAVKPTTGPTSTPAVQSHGGQSPSPHQETRHQIGRDVVNIGKSVVIKGELNGSEDLTIEGQVEGKIELKDHVLTIGPNGKIKAQVFAKARTSAAASTCSASRGSRDRGCSSSGPPPRPACLSRSSRRSRRSRNHS